MADHADRAQDYLDQAAEIREQQRLDRLAADLRGLLVSDCADCGAEIPAERKAAIPGAIRCAFCQESREIQLRVQRGWSARWER